MQQDYQDVYNEDSAAGASDPNQGGSWNGASGLNPGDPGTYYGSDNVWYGPDGAPLPNQGRNPGAPPPEPRHGTPTAPGEPAPAPPPEPTSAGIGGSLAPFAEAAPTLAQQPAFQPLKFTAPSMQDALANPGYQFRVQQGRDQLQNWAAARGTLNDSGIAKALEDYGQSSAEQGYGEVYARNFGEYQSNESALERAYGMNRQSQYIDPWTAAYNAWQQRGNFYYQNQGNITNGALGFAQLL